MDYKELIENLKTWEEEYISCACGERNIKCQQFCLPDKDCLATQVVTAITDLLARAEAAEERAEKAERELQIAVGGLVGQCKYCRKNQECTSRKGSHLYCWEWRGAKEE